MGYIYKIENTVNGKVYIGRTIREFDVRKEEHIRHLNGNYHINKHLQSSWNKHGEGNFKFSILDQSDDIECLYCLEGVRLGEYRDAIGVQNVYNIAPILRSFRGKRKRVSDSARQKMSENMRRRISDPEYFSKLLEWGKMGREVYSQMERKEVSPATREKMRQNRLGSKHPDKTLEKMRKSAAKRAKYRGYFVSPNQEIVEVFNLNLFCKNNDLEISAMIRVFSGKRVSHKGWQLLDSREKKNTAKTYKGFVSPDGVIYIDVRNLKKFCETYNLGLSGMSQLSSGKLDKYKGWTRLN